MSVKKQYYNKSSEEGPVPLDQPENTLRDAAQFYNMYKKK